MNISQIHNARSGLHGDCAITLAREKDISTDLNMDNMDTLGLENLTFKKGKKNRSVRRRNARLRANSLGTQNSRDVKADSHAQIMVDSLDALSQSPHDGYSLPSSRRTLGQDTAQQLRMTDSTNSKMMRSSVSVNQPNLTDHSSCDRVSAAAQTKLPTDRVPDPRDMELGEKARTCGERVMGEYKDGHTQSSDKQGPLTDTINQLQSSAECASQHNVGFNRIQPSIPVFHVVPSWRINKWHRYNTVPNYHALPVQPLGRPVALESPNLIATAISCEADCSPRPASVSAHTVRGLQTDEMSQKKRYNLRSREVHAPQGKEHKTQGPCPPKLGRSVTSEHSATSASTGMKPLSGPIPTAEYLSLAALSPQLAPGPQHLLLVLDLNGTLIYRQRASSKYSSRPSLQYFLDYCFENHSVMIWSSATPSNVSAVCAQMFSLGRRRELLGEWGRDTLDLSNAEYYAKTQVFKRLDRIWDGVALRNSHPDAERGGHWGQANTLLLDDSVLKAQAQPYNLVEVPEFTRPGRHGQQDESQEVLRQVVAYLEEARSYENVSAFVRTKKFTIGAAPQRDWKESRKIKDDNAEDGGVAVGSFT